jgi:aspartyl-tRNA(Asn)/glutamyl-tRNA(Gln) amidotransferase subunit B
VKQVVAGNAGAVADYASGKQQALTFIIGQVMKVTRGRANPGLVKEIIMQELGGK